jgi:pimeloyl-ACP methyl ester carboxylesterase
MSFGNSETSSTRGLPPGSLQVGAGEPLLLLHGVMGTPRMWQPTIPSLSAQHQVIALAALGHHGGRPCDERPCLHAHVVDDAERSLDAMGIDRVHIAGNSMGGWMALELARRGRARSVCAFSPAGMWETTRNFEGAKKLRATIALTRMTRATLPLTSKLRAIRHFALRDTAEHGERVPAELLISMADAVLGCSVADDLLSTPEKCEPLSVNCPVDIVWSDKDRIFPPEPFARSARERIPGARHLMLNDVGHVPMLDNPELVARTILSTIASART